MVDYPDVRSVGAFVPDPLYGLIPQKNFSFESLDWRLRDPNNGVKGFDKKVTFNSLGYRGKEFPIRKHPETLRMVIFGGSTTMDTGNDDRDTWPARLEAKLQEDATFLGRHGVKSVEVINAGVGGWRTREGLLRLRNEVISFDPDIIMIAFVWNDAWQGIQGIDIGVARKSAKPWWYHSALLQNLRIRYLASKDNDANLHQSWTANLQRDAAWAQTYVSNILEMLEIRQEITKAKIVLINLPGLCRDENTTSVEYRLIIGNTRVSSANYVLWVRLKRFISNLLHDLGRKHGVEVVDVHRYFEQFAELRRLELFADEMHTTKLGSEQIAQAIYRAVRTM